MPKYAGPRELRQLLDAVVTVGADLDLQAMLRRIVESATSLVDAHYGALGVLDEERTGLSQFITVGIDDETHRAIGDLPRGHGILGVLITDAKPLRLPDLTRHPDSYGFPPHHPPMKSFLGVPILVRGEAFGNLYLTDKLSADMFTDVDEELAAGLAAAAGVAIENARLHARVQDLLLAEDRERIARDLHDTVIQRLFATGLTLQGTIPLIGIEPEKVAERVETAVDDLDQTVKQVRSAIFGLETVRMAHRGLRARVLEVIRDAVDVLGFEPSVFVDGPIDTGVTEDLASNLLATLGEALTNVARHARADRVNIELIADSTSVVLRVRDNGIGPPVAPTATGSGLKNTATRARHHGGTMTLTPDQPRGTVFEWRAERG